MNTNLIGISGKAGSGKSTVGKIILLLTFPDINVADTNKIIQLYDFCEQNRLWNTVVIYNSTSWRLKAFAGKLKDRIALTFNIDRYLLDKQLFKREKADTLSITWRELMQLEGDKMREINEDYWVNALFADYKDTPSWIIHDVRYLNEAQAIENRHGILIRVNRDVKGNNHSSEIELDSYNNWDYVIDNNEDIDVLIQKVRDILLDLKAIK